MQIVKEKKDLSSSSKKKTREGMTKFNKAWGKKGSKIVTARKSGQAFQVGKLSAIENTWIILNRDLAIGWYKLFTP